MAAYCPDELKSPACRLLVHRDQLRAQRSVTSMGELLFFNHTTLVYLNHNNAVATASKYSFDNYIIVVKCAIYGKALAVYFCTCVTSLVLYA